MMRGEEDAIEMGERGRGDAASSASAKEEELLSLRQKVAQQEALIRDLLSAQEAQDRGQRHRIDLATMYVRGSGAPAPTAQVMEGLGAEDNDRDGSDGEEDGSLETERLLPGVPVAMAQALPLASATVASPLQVTTDSGSAAVSGMAPLSGSQLGTSNSHGRSGDSRGGGGGGGSDGVLGGFRSFMTEAELADAQLAMMLQNMEMAAAGHVAMPSSEPRQEQHTLEDPVWGKVEYPPGVRPKPHHVLCFNCCPCLVGNVLDWSGGRSLPLLPCLGWRLPLPALHSSKAAVLSRLGRTWALGLAVLQVVLMTAMVLWGGSIGGLAPREINPMLGPWPTTLVLFGAKNTALILYENQWWRLLTPALLHAGFIHLFVNLIIQMRLGVFLEYEWGWKKWLTVYVVAAGFSSLMSCIFLPDQLGVGSSGALMGLMGAWFVEIVCKWSSEELDEDDHEQQRSHFMMVTLNIGVTLGFSFVPYVDWAAHVGGMLAGMAVGLYLFGDSLPAGVARRYTPRVAATVLAVASLAAVAWLLARSNPDPALVDVCGYYAAAFPSLGPLPAC